MTDILSSMQVVLREVGFTTSSLNIENISGVCFEDDSVIGFGCVFDNASELLGCWKTIEKAFLIRNAQSLRSAGEKAWNVYLVLLVSRIPESSVIRQVHWVEEDLERTRKIAACGVTTREALVTALLPLLPIQYRPVLSVDDTAKRLANRIELVAPRVAKVALDDTVEPMEVIRLIEEST